MNEVIIAGVATKVELYLEPELVDQVFVTLFGEGVTIDPMVEQIILTIER